MSRLVRKAKAKPKAPQGAPVLSLRGVTRTYETAAGGLSVLKGVDLEQYRGKAREEVRVSLVA